MPLDPNSLVDYLRSIGQDSRFAARRALWARFDPRERYGGAADQNTRLLAFLRFGDAAPSIVLNQLRYNQGDTVIVTVRSSTTVLIENEFGQNSIQCEPGEQVNLGTISTFGSFSLRVKTGLQAMHMCLGVTPAGNILSATSFDVGIWESAVEYSSEPTPVPVQAGDDDLMLKFWEGLDQAGIFEQAFSPAFEHFNKADQWFGLGFDIAIGGLVAVISPVQGGWLVVKATIPQLIDFAGAYLAALADLMTNLTDAEKTRLKLIFSVTISLAQIGASVRSLKKADAVCETLEAIGELGDPSVKLFQLAAPQPEGVAMAGAMLRNSVTKSISMVCRITKHSH
jgi:hypothetical protein